MVEGQNSVTFRVRRVPANLTRHNLAIFLSHSVTDLGSADNIRVRSLAASPGDWNSPPQQTATVEFLQLPTCLQDEREKEFLRFIGESEDTLLFDKVFLGFTPLNKVIRHDCDCIAVSGLASHPFGSWRRRGSQHHQFMWLRDQLPHDFPHMRIMIYGYDTTLFDSESLQDIDDLARSFISHLKAIGIAEHTARPLILLAHSLGGILVKRALSYLAASGEAENFMLSRVRLVLCFGVPNQGMHTKHLLAMTDGRPNQVLVDSLSTTAPYLANLEKSFSGIAIHRSIRLVSVYETVKSPVALRNSSGQWERTGQPEYLVTRESAIQSGSRDPEDIIHINKDHSEMVKFAPDDTNYLSIRNFILDIVKHVSMSGTVTASKNPGYGSSSLHNLLLHETPSGVDESLRSEESATAVEDRYIDESLENSDHADLSDSSDTSPQEAPSNVKLHKTHVTRQKDLSALMNNLDFEDRVSRLRAIESAEISTFGWIFTNKDIRFMEWLFDENVLFWIRGKPGSGKSTLMKYLHDNAHLRTALENRNPARKQIDLWFFFNDRGTYLQKSLDGLLRSILFQLRAQERRLFDMISEAQDFMFDQNETSWTIDKLTTFFQAFMLQQNTDIDIILFLDALDEYHGFPEVIARWIADLAFKNPPPRARTTVKICVSCRPWDVFLKTFSSCPGFILHKYTMEDIEQYTALRLSRMSHILPPSHQESILKTIPQRAEGVFLWVKLAVDELAISSVQMSLAELEQLIAKIPDELESLYVRTILRIPQHIRPSAYMILEIVYRASNFRTSQIPSADDLYRILACAKGATYRECQNFVSISRSMGLEEAHDIIQDLVKLSGGLLEVEPHHNNKLQFMHKTARDFVGSPGFAQIILQERYSIQSENGYTSLFKWQIASYSPKSESAVAELVLIAELAYMDEKTTGRPLTAFIDSIPDIFFQDLKAAKRDPFETILPGKPFVWTSSFIFAVDANLQLYVKSALSNADRQLDTPQIVDQRPLNMAAGFIKERNLEYDRYSAMMDPNMHKMFELLLDHGFSANDQLHGLNAFEILFQLRQKTKDRFMDLSSRAMAEIVRALITTGKQDPNVLLTFTGSILPRKGTALHVSDGHMTQVLLENGANPNTLDSDNNTALDTCLKVLLKAIHQNSVEYALKPESFKSREKVPLLLAHGGKFSQKYARSVSKHVDFLRNMFPPASVEALLAMHPLPESLPKIKAAKKFVKGFTQRFSPKSKSDA